ncbi:MAG: AraC family transcriptional regulator [Burkholderiaceae bacterium]
MTPPTMPHLAQADSAQSESIRSGVLSDVADYLIALGHDPTPVYAQLGIDTPALANRDNRVPTSAVMTLLNRCAEITGQDDFGLRVAERRGMPDLGPIVLLLNRESTLRGALHTLAQALHLHSNALYISFDEGERSAVLAMDVMTGGVGLSRHSAEMVVSAMLYMVHWLLGSDWRPQAVCFRHEARLPERVYRRYLRCRPDFGQEFNGVVIDRADLDRALDHATGKIRRQAEHFIATLADESETFVYRVRQLLVLTLPRGDARADTIATLLGADRRTIHRRLARAGLNFSTLLDRVRRELAMQYVTSSAKPFSDIALILGFESLSVFSRWFRQAFGNSPTAVRRRAASE